MNVPSAEPGIVRSAELVTPIPKAVNTLGFAQIVEETLKRKSNRFTTIVSRELLGSPSTNNSWLYLALAFKVYQPDFEDWEVVYEELKKHEIGSGYIKRVGSEISTSFDELIGIIWLLSQGPRTQLSIDLLKRICSRLEIYDGTYLPSDEVDGADYRHDVYRMLDMRAIVRSAIGLNLSLRQQIAWSIAAAWKIFRLPEGASHWLRLWLQSDIIRGHALPDFLIKIWKQRMSAAEISLYSCLVSEPREIPEIAEEVLISHQNW